MAIIERKFDGEVYTLHGIRQTKSWAKKETKRLRETGFKVRNTKFPNKVAGGTFYYVWKRDKKTSNVEYRDLHKMMKNGIQRIAHNVGCGLVSYTGEQIIGCGKRATSDSPHYGYYYKTNGCFSSVYLCERCKKKVGKKKEKPKKFKPKYADYWKFEGGY